jgi:hypothetical protein
MSYSLLSEIDALKKRTGVTASSVRVSEPRESRCAADFFGWNVLAWGAPFLRRGDSENSRDDTEFNNQAAWHCELILRNNSRLHSRNLLSVRGPGTKETWK